MIISIIGLSYKNSMNDIMVSVICNAYNHEEYIKDALNGFVSQKTSFAFEVLVHDDASTDRTAEIIRKYEHAYPDIIKPIYSHENQYSKNDGSLSRIQYGRVRGKYIAICEGDDYWTDSLKLQKQFDALESHPNNYMCSHSASFVSNGKCIKIVAPINGFGYLTPEDVIKGGGDYIMTNTLFFRKELIQKKMRFREVFDFDYSLQILGSLCGNILFLPDNMSVYRYQSSPTAWTSNRNVKKAKIHSTKIEQMLDTLDEETQYAYHDVIKQKISESHFNFYYSYGPYCRLYNHEYRSIRRNATLTKRAKILIKYVYGRVFKKKYEHEIDNE